MKVFLNAMLYTALIFCFISCDKNKVDSSDKENLGDCSFVQVDEDMDGLIDDNEREIMNDCKANAFTSISEIKENLIGEWQLIGHGEGWVSKVSQPCAYLTISEEAIQLEYEDAYMDTVSMHTWEIEEVSINTIDYFRLKVENPAFALGISQFCEDYIYGDATDADGNMYLYQKVK